MPETARTVALSFGATDQGPRGNNEDVFHHDDERGIYFVVDGMGGHNAGEEAAAIAKARLIGRLERAIGTVEQRIREAIALANNAIFDAAQSRNDWHGMACVLTVAIVDQGQVTVGHVGDSRLYRVLPDRLEKMTYDHSPVGRLEDTKEISEAEAMSHPRRNEVFRDVGSTRHEPDEPGFIDIYRFTFQPSSAFFICSDGLSDVLSSEEMRETIEEHAPDRSAVVRALIQTAVDDGKDNTTVVFVQGPEFRSAAKSKGRPSRSRRKLAPVLTSDLTNDPPAPPLTPEPTYIAPRPNRWSKMRVALLMGASFLAGVLGTLGVQYLLRPAAPITPLVPPAVTLRVQPGADTRPISAALLKAKAGDTIDIAPGEYTDQLQLKDGVKLVGHDAILRPPASITGTEAAITAAGIKEAAISGLRILPPAHGQLSFGIHISGGKVDLNQVQVSGARLAAIDYSGDSTGAIDSCIIKDNAGAGILIRENAGPSVIGNRIVNNGRQGTARLPGLHIASLKEVPVNGNIFMGNAAEAIWQPAVATPELLEGNVFGPNGARGKPADIRLTGTPRAQP